MAPDETYIISPKDPLSIVKLQDPTIIEQLLENPPAVLAELLAGWFASGNGFLAAAGCKIAQAAFKGRVFKEFAREFNDLRQKGRIADNFPENKCGRNSWVELLTILDEDTPDEDRLDALKAIFYSVNKVNAADGERILAYQLFQIAKRLRSGPLLLMKICYTAFKNGHFDHNQPVPAGVWLPKTANNVGHGLTALVEQDEKVLVENGLIYPRNQMGQVPESNGRLTDLGIKFCQNLEEYRVASEESARDSGG